MALKEQKILFIIADLFNIFIAFNKTFAPFFQVVTARTQFNIRVCQSNRDKI